MKRVILILLFLLPLLLMPAGVALASTRNDRVIEAGETINRDVTVYGGNLEIKPGAEINGNVFVYGGNVSLAGDINGDVSVFGGNTDLAGAISGDVVVFGGNINVEETAVVDGDCFLMGGNVSGEGAAGITCTTLSRLPSFNLPALPSIISAPPFSPPHSYEPPHPSSRIGLFFINMFRIFSRSVLLGILALVVGAIIPDNVNRISQVIRRQPAVSGAVGLLTAVAVPSLATLLTLLSAILVLVCIGVLGFPIVILLLMALAAAALMGWIAIGDLLGQRLARSLKLNHPSLTVTAALGTVVLTLGAGILSLMPFYLGGWLVTWAAISVGLGAAALTQFGAKPYPREEAAGESDGKVADVLKTLPDDS